MSNRLSSLRNSLVSLPWKATGLAAVKTIVWLPWQTIVLVAWFVSFGALNLSAKRSGKGALRRVWGFFFPFLLSRDAWDIVVPKSVSLPWWKFGGWRQPTEKKWFARGFAVLFATILYLNYQVPAATAMFQSYLGSWTIVVVSLIVPILLAVALFKSVPVPTWKLNPLSIGVAESFTFAYWWKFSGWRRQWAIVPVPTWTPTRLIHLPFIGGRKLLTLPEGLKGWLLLGLVGLGIFLVNYYAVQMNELNGAFMNAITEKKEAEFGRILIAFGGVMAIFTVLGPVYGYVKALFILEWTKFTTKFMLRLYTKNRNFYPVSLLRTPDNPNERIEQDVPAMCRASLSFAFIFVDSIVTFFAFGGILWKAEEGLIYEIPFFGHTLIVEHLLLWILVAYAILGSNGVVRVGWRLIKLLAENKRLSADFRVGMVLFEKYAEPIAAYHGQEREHKSLWHRFSLALKNNYAIVRWQRNLGFFTSGYGRVAQLLPYGALAPFYFSGKIAFGTISQAVGAFGEILASASIFVSEFDRLTGLLASINRVGELRDTMEDFAKKESDGLPRIKHVEGKMLTISDMTLFTPDRSKVLVRNLNLDMKPGRSVLIKGPSGSGKTSILRSVVGLPLWDRGEGTIAMPSAVGRTLMLTQLAYLPSDASLRDQMQYPSASGVSDDELVAVLKSVNLEHLLEQLGGLDATPNWDQLSGGERQRLVVARSLVNKVQLVIADEATSGLDIKNEKLLYSLMKAAGTTMLSVGHRPSLVQFHEDVIELLGDGNGGWRMIPADQSTW